MEDVQQEQALVNRRRRSYTREFKLGVIKYYRKHGESIHRTSDHYKVDRKQVRNWLKKEVNIIGQKKKSKAQRFGKVRYPELEKKLYDEFIEKRKEGRIIKKWWFVARARQIARSEYKDTDFKVSNSWFVRFRQRFKISYRKKTHVAQKSPAELRESVEMFHKASQAIRRRGVYQLKDLANMDQTPLPFVLDDGKTYDKTGVDEVWCASGGLPV